MHVALTTKAKLMAEGSLSNPVQIAVVAFNQVDAGCDMEWVSGLLLALVEALDGLVDLRALVCGILALLLRVLHHSLQPC